MGNYKLYCLFYIFLKLNEKQLLNKNVNFSQEYIVIGNRECTWYNRLNHYLTVQKYLFLVSLEKKHQ